MDLDVRRQAMYLGRARFLLGLGMVLTPATSARLWTGRDPSSATKAWTRMTGLRELAIGAGTSIAASERSGGAGWLSMAALVDLGGGAVALFSPGVPKRTRLAGLVSASFGLAQLRLSRQLAESSSAPA